VQKTGEEAGCPAAGWRIEGIGGYFLANTREWRAGAGVRGCFCFR